jgi:hypothetical protein
MNCRAVLKLLSCAVLGVGALVLSEASTTGVASAGTGGTVQGHVQAQGGVALNDICVSLVKPGRTNTPNVVLVQFAPSDLSGFFTQANVPAGRYVGYYSQCGPITTGSSNTEPVATYTGGTLAKGSAQKFTVTDGSTTDLGIQQLAAGGDTSGTLLDARSGTGAPFVSIDALTPTGGILLTQGCTDTSGHYTVFNMPSTGIKLEFAPTKTGTCGNDVAFLPQWFGGSNYASASLVPITPGTGGTVPTTTLTDSSARQSITSIAFTGLGSGKAFAPTLTITGTNLGKSAPAADPATPTSCGTPSPSSGFDYGKKLYFNDWTSGWQAGHIGDCIGFVVNSWTPTQIKLTLGDFYFDAQYGAILSGDQYTMVVKGAVLSGTVG